MAKRSSGVLEVGWVRDKFNILQVCTSDISGGAQRVAWNLFRSYRSLNYGSWLAVGHKLGDDSDVLPIANDVGRRGWARFWWSLHRRVQRWDGNGRLSRLAHKLAEPAGFLDYYRGTEDFRFPGSWRLLELTPHPVDILHCHNLHGGYFDLRAISWLSRKVPTILTLHDAWLLSGHCAHSFDCERWRVGCGQCPDLTIYPAIRQDATAFNWMRKREIYKTSRLYVASPSGWLMQKAEESMLRLGMAEARVIPNGVDLEIFRPVDREAARARLKLSKDARVIVFVANGIRTNIWKDYETMREATGRIAARGHNQRIIFLGLGEDGAVENTARSQIRFIPYRSDPAELAAYYQAADVYMHAARAETFPNTILEALACGTPVVATAVGGIPEQVKGLQNNHGSMNRYGSEEATGFLTSPGNAEELSVHVEELLTNEVLRQQMSKNAAIDARRRFDLNRQVYDYLTWYQSILATFKREHRDRS